ncbi:MAG: hypothetical protein V3T53_09890 [Phycisphaerales bacterium]
MRRFGTKALAIIVLTALQACSASGPKFVETAPLPGQSLVHVYRTSRLFGSGNVFTIHVNGEAVTELGNGGYYSLSAAPGILEFNAVRKIGFPLLTSAIDHAAMKDDIQLRLQTLPDAIYYVEFRQGFGSVRMEKIPPDKALKSLRSLRQGKDLRGQSKER